MTNDTFTKLATASAEYIRGQLKALSDLEASVAVSAIETQYAIGVELAKVGASMGMYFPVAGNDSESSDTYDKEAYRAWEASLGFANKAYKSNALARVALVELIGEDKASAINTAHLKELAPVVNGTNAKRDGKLLSPSARAKNVKSVLASARKEGGQSFSGKDVQNARKAKFASEQREGIPQRSTLNAILKAIVATDIGNIDFAKVDADDVVRIAQFSDNLTIAFGNWTEDTSTEEEEQAA